MVKDKKVKARKELTCKACGYRWTPKIDNPKCCSRCKSFKWNK